MKNLFLFVMLCFGTLVGTTATASNASSELSANALSSTEIVDQNVNLTFPPGSNSTVLTITIRSGYQVINFRHSFDTMDTGTISGNTVSMIITKSMVASGSTVYCEVDGYNGSSYLGNRVYVHVSY